MNIKASLYIWFQLVNTSPFLLHIDWQLRELNVNIESCPINLRTTTESLALKGEKRALCPLRWLRENIQQSFWYYIS